MSDWISINGVELSLFQNQMLLNGFWQFIPNFISCVRRVEKQCASFLEIFHKIDHLKENPVVTADKLCLSDQIG